MASTDLATVLDAMLEGFQVLDAELRYLHLNDVAARHGRKSKEELIGRRMADCYPGVEATPLYAAMQRAVATQTPEVLENAFTYPDGSVGHFELRLAPVPAGLCVLSIDVSDRKAAEERLRHAQRMEAVGQLAAGIAHDFNNLITVMLGQGELALARPLGVAREDVEILLAAARTSAELTRQLLAYGRRSVVHCEVVDLPQVLSALGPLFQRTLPSNVAFSVEAQPALRTLADRSQVEQVLMNLVVNARDAMPRGGQLAVRAAEATLDAQAAGVVTGGLTPGRYVELTVADTGTGMTPETAARIFEPFYTTKKRGEGTGLGLATVYGITKRHGGTILVDSLLGQGTTFRVYLPATDREVVVEEPPPPSAAAPSSAQRVVLVVEDTPMIRSLMSAVLTRAGYEVLLAESGADALAVWNDRRGKVALLITDVMMPGMSGPELITKLRQMAPDLPVICTSGYSDDQLSGADALPAAVVFLEKPFSGSALVQRVASMLPT